MRCKKCLAELYGKETCPNCGMLEGESVDKVFIDGVKVRNLFGVFNYNIDFRNEARVSILITPNGCGKTTIFNLINFVLNPNTSTCSKIINVPFDTFECILSNGVSITLNKGEIERYTKLSRGHMIHFYYIIDNNGYTEKFEVPVLTYLHDGKFIVAVDTPASKINFNPMVYPIFKNLVDYYDGVLEKKFKRIVDAIAFFVPNINYSRADRGAFDVEKEDEYNKLGVNHVHITNYDEVTGAMQVFNSTGMNGINMTKRFMMSLKQDRDTLDQHLHKFPSSDFKISNISNSMKVKMNTFKEIYDKRNVWTKKTIDFDVPHGFDIKQNGRSIDLDYLSSGEKNDFVLLFDLMFRSAEFGVTIIDEPEVSLHIEWQESLLEHILTCCALNNTQVIISTHSPSIISGKVELLADMEIVR